MCWLYVLRQQCAAAASGPAPVPVAVARGASSAPCYLDRSDPAACFCGMPLPSTNAPSLAAPYEVLPVEALRALVSVSGEWSIWRAIVKLP